MQPRLLRSPARLAGTSLLRVQTDDRLVALARDGHDRAFAAIVERYRPALERYAARLVGPSRGEDAVQQAFVNAHAALIANPDQSIELRPWLYRIVHNAALNTLRSARDEQPLGEAAEMLPLHDDAIERRERLREALDALAALPANQRDAILLRELEGRSHDEIAVALGMTPGAARQQIFRARAALRAAATAITPQPLLVRALELAGSGSGSGAADAAAGAGAGLTAVLAKAGAGVLVTGAVVGGAVGTGVVHTPRLHEHRPAQARQAAAHPKGAAVSTHRSGSAGAAADSAGHGARQDRNRSASRSEHSSEHSRTGDHRGRDDRGRRGSSSAPATRPVNQHRVPGRTGTTVPEVHHGGATNDAAGTGHSGHHGHHGGRGGADDTVAGATTQPESAEVETETPEVETGGGGANSGGANGGGGNGGGGGTQTTTDAQPPATTTPATGTVTTAPTPGGAGGGGATTVLPPDAAGGKGK